MFAVTSIGRSESTRCAEVSQTLIGDGMEMIGGSDTGPIGVGGGSAGSSGVRAGGSIGNSAGSGGICCARAFGGPQYPFI
jgi:hypothetical protein